MSIDLPTNGQAFNPILLEYTFEKQIKLGGNSQMVCQLAIQPQNRSSSAIGSVSIYSYISNSVPPVIDLLYKSPPHQFTYIQNNNQNTMRFIYHTPPHALKMNYLVQFEVQFDNNTDSLYRMRMDVEKTRKLEPMAIDQCYIKSPAGKRFLIGQLEFISSSGGINILNDAREIITDQIKSGESWGSWSDLVADSSIEIMFFPTKLQRLSLNPAPRNKSTTPIMDSPITVELLLNDRLLFASNIGLPDMENSTIDFYFEKADSADRGDSLPMNHEIEFGGMAIATPGKIWLALSILTTILLFNLSYTHPSLGVLQFLAVVPIVVYYFFNLGDADRIKVVLPLPRALDKMQAAIKAEYDEVMTHRLKWQLITIGILLLFVIFGFAAYRWNRQF